MPRRPLVEVVLVITVPVLGDNICKSLLFFIRHLIPSPNPSASVRTKTNVIISTGETRQNSKWNTVHTAMTLRHSDGNPFGVV